MLKSKIKQLEPTQAESAAPQRREGERSEPDRSGGTADSGGAAPATVPDPEVPAKPKRRQFTAEYKRSIVAQAEACRDDGVNAGRKLGLPRFWWNIRAKTPQTGVRGFVTVESHYDRTSAASKA